MCLCLIVCFWCTVGHDVRPVIMVCVLVRCVCGVCVCVCVRVCSCVCGMVSC